MIHCDMKMCVGCRMCEVACADFHFGAVSPALSRIRVAKLESIGIEMAVSCYSCLEKPCLECPTDALSVAGNGRILLEEDDCIACEACVEACPVGAAVFVGDIPLFCDLCDGETSCVNVCPSGALSFREDHKEFSLQHFMASQGNASNKRAIYANFHGEAIRESWKNGRRIDS